jgi:hypothetical protein
MGGDSELATTHLANFLGKGVGTAKNSVKGFGEAGSQSPADGSLGMYRRRSAYSQRAGDASVFDYGTTIHEFTPEELLIKYLALRVCTRNKD